MAIGIHYCRTHIKLKISIIFHKLWIQMLMRHIGTISDLFYYSFIVVSHKKVVCVHFHPLIIIYSCIFLRPKITFCLFLNKILERWLQNNWIHILSLFHFHSFLFCMDVFSRYVPTKNKRSIRDNFLWYIFL